MNIDIDIVVYDSDLTTEYIIHQLSNSVHLISYHTAVRDVPPSQNGYGCFFFFGAAAVAPAVAAREEETSLTWTLLLLIGDFESAATGIASRGQMGEDMVVSSCCGMERRGELIDSPRRRKREVRSHHLLHLFRYGSGISPVRDNYARRQSDS